MMLALLIAATAPDFDAIRFFSGRTHGEGRLKVVLHPGDDVHVDGDGRVEPDGTLILDQIVTRGDRPPQPRQWRLRRVAPGRYQGTLTDARGAVVGETIGNRLHLAFKSREGFDVEQWLTLGAGGRHAANHLVARRFGVVVATLDEDIVKVD